MRRLICILLLLVCLSTTVYANPNMQADVGNIDVPMSTPLIDGSIAADEGWSEGVYAHKDLMATFGNCNEILQSFYLYYAYDKDGIYYAADILDNSFVLSTGEDDIDNVQNDFNIKNEVVYGYNGDIFTFVIDPLGRFLEEGYMSNTDYNTWYSVGIFENNICRMYRAHNRSGDITSDVKVKGQVTNDGWCFEAFIPWEFICQDTDELSFGDISVTTEELCSGGAKHRAMAIYMDRFIDPEAGEVATFQRFATCGYILADGLKGYLSSGVCLKAYGITLSFGENGEVTEPVETDETTIATGAVDTTIDTKESEKSTETESGTHPVTTQTGSKLTTQKTASKTSSTTKKAVTGGITGDNAAQTGDIGVGIAIGVAAIAVIAFIFVKKKL